MGCNLPQVIHVEHTRNKNPQLCTTAGLWISKGRASIVRERIKCEDTNNSNNSHGNHLTSEATKRYLTVKLAKPQSGPCTLRQCLLQHNTGRAWRRGRTGIVPVVMALLLTGPLKPSRFYHPVIDSLPGELLNIVSNLLHQRLCVRIRLGAVTSTNSALWAPGVSPLISTSRSISMVKTLHLS